MQPSLLWIAYIANILILIPVCWSMFVGGGVASVFDGRVAESAGLRIMVASLWFAILIASVVGLFVPNAMAPIILVQIIYKSLWLVVFIRPEVKASGWESVPHGITLCFLAIVVTYPVILGAHLLRAPGDMMRFGHEVTTTAEPDAVWSLWTDPESWSCWDKGLAEADGPSPLQAGSTGTITALNGSVASYRVTLMEKGRAYTFETALPLATLTVEREITGSGPTRFRHAVSFSGPLGGVFARLLGKDFSSALPPTMDALANAADGRHPCLD